MKQQFLTCFFTKVKSKSSSPVPSLNKDNDSEQGNSCTFANTEHLSAKAKDNSGNIPLTPIKGDDNQKQSSSYTQIDETKNSDSLQCKESDQKKQNLIIFPKIILKKVDDDEPLRQDFYQQDVVTLARELIGKVMVRTFENGDIIKCMIVETEAYKAPLDKACHAYNNKKTERTKYFWLPGGHVYMFTIYRTNVCFNIVAGKENEPEAVLLRAVEPIEGISLVYKNRDFKSKKLKDLTNGPGKLTQAMNISMDFNGLDLTKKGKLYLVKGNYSNFEVEASKRINIDYSGPEWSEKPWRFTMKGNNFVSLVNKQ